MQAASSGTKYGKFASISNEQWMSIAKEREKTSDGRAVWLALTANHGGEEKMRAILCQALIEKFRRCYP